MAGEGCRTQALRLVPCASCIQVAWQEQVSRFSCCLRCSPACGMLGSGCYS